MGKGRERWVRRKHEERETMLRRREREVESNLSFHFGIISSMIVTRNEREGKRRVGEREG